MKKKQFTLIELLVVIAIIAVLATMLFPVVGSMKERSLQTKCTSNLSQLGKALMAYSMDNENAFPYAQGQDTKAGGGDKHAKNLIILRKSQVGEEPALYLCPSSTRANNVGATKDRKDVTDTDFDKDNISYAYFTGEDPENQNGVSTATMKQGSGILSDANCVGNATEKNLSNGWNHDTNGRWLRVDGSVQSSTATNWPDKVGGNSQTKGTWNSFNLN